MARYEVTGPDGRRYEITAPEGATEQDALNHFMKSMPSAKPQDAYKETAQKQSTLENLLAGAGGAMYGAYLGGKQMLGLAKPEEIAQHKQAMDGLRSTKAGTAGDILGNVAVAAPAAFIPGANTYVGSSLIGAGLGALQPTAENESRGENMAFGAAGGAAGKYVGDKLIAALRGQGNSARQQAVSNVEQTAGLSAPEREILRRGQGMGFKVTPGQAAGSKTLQKLEAALESNPFTAGAFEDIKRHNAGVLNRETAKAIGEQSDYVNSTVLEQAKDRISGVYRMVADDKTRQISTEHVLKKIDRIDKELEGVLPANVSFRDNPLVKNFVSLVESGQATGKQLQQAASKLSRASFKNMSGMQGDRDLGIALAQVKDIADAHLRKGLTGETAKLFDDARLQYRNLMNLTSRTGVVNSSTGDVSKAALPNVLASKDKAGYVMGKNKSDFYNAARFGETFKPIVGDSGTATRSMQNLSLENLAKLPFGLVARLYTSQPANAAAAGIGNLINNGISPEAALLLRDPAMRTLPALGAYGGTRSNDR